MARQKWDSLLDYLGVPIAAASFVFSQGFGFHNSLYLLQAGRISEEMTQLRARQQQMHMDLDGVQENNCAHHVSGDISPLPSLTGEQPGVKCP